MRRLTALLTLVTAATLSLAAQVSARSAFTTAPLELLPSLPQDIRLDMLDYYDSGIERPSTDIFGRQAIIKSMTDDILTIAFGDDRIVSLAVLPQDKGEIIMAIDRVATPATDAALSFYNSRWQPIDTNKMLQLPRLADWTGKISKTDLADLQNALPFVMFDADYDPASHILTLTRQTGDFIADSDIPLINRLMRPAIAYTWDGRRFKEQ